MVRNEIKNQFQNVVSVLICSVLFKNIFAFKSKLKHCRTDLFAMAKSVPLKRIVFEMFALNKSKTNTCDLRWAGGL